MVGGLCDTSGPRRSCCSTGFDDAVTHRISKEQIVTVSASTFIGMWLDYKQPRVSWS